MENSMHNLKAYLVYSIGHTSKDAYVEVNMQGSSIPDVRKRFMNIAHKFFDPIYTVFKVGIDNTHLANEQELIEQPKVVGFERKVREAFLEELALAA